MHELLAGADRDIALVDASRSVSYAELRERVIVRAAELGCGRRLLMLSCRRDVETVVSLLAALVARHAVILLGDEESTSKQWRRRLIETYDPDTVVGSRADAGASIEHRRGASVHDLHPELALLLSTSGSTGSPKLVRLSGTSVISNARAISDYLELGPEDCGATTLPLHYCYGLSILTSHLVAGARVLVTASSVIQPEFRRDAARAGVSSIAGVPHTFDLLSASGFDPAGLPSLRLMTQAGGRMDPERVREWARRGAECGVSLVVMYGATEATARMAYLPAPLAMSRPGAIGIAIPGGALRIDDPDDAGEGELVYSGPNVMMGYAETPDDLARGQEVRELRTGDLARRTADGLFEIVGRMSRFVKIFGLRLDLDRLERILAAEGVPAYAVESAGGVLIGTTCAEDADRAPGILSAATGIPRACFRHVVLDQLAVTSSGKADRQELRRLSDRLPGADLPVEDPTAPGERATTVEAVRSMYAAVLERPEASEDDSFVSLDGDSLSFVEAAHRLERIIGDLPAQWPSLSARELAEHAAALPAPSIPSSDGAGRPATGRRRRPRASVETAVALRAVCIILIVGTHANLLGLQGGAHVLLAVLGYNLARFPLAPRPRGARLRGLARSALLIAVPSMLWIGGVSLVTARYDLSTVLLLNSVLGDDSAWSEQWRFWFLEAALGAIVLAGAALSIRLIDRAERRSPFLVVSIALALALLIRVVDNQGVLAEGVARYTLPSVLWLVVLGAAAERAGTRAQRIGLSLVAVAGTAGFLGDPLREAVVIAGLLVLIWVRAVPVPRAAAAAMSALAAASLFIYLVHWEIYPAWEDDAPVFATVASIAGGLLVFAVWRRLRRTAARLPSARSGQRRLAT
ncbi:AMP-binding protein [Microcella daejeonensis]|uniref:AMP-binding protein n=1 Tax=Microcella daejeonensis TaxID=2994971 RepID=UPI00226E9C02|nr:AMP-binding protein [Microcella daejeonensis]WAB83983.1 AMP-binding protein [Microcella daejeonensis]